MRIKSTFVIFFVIVLSFNTLLLAQASTPPSNYTTSDGSEESPYFISSLENLIWLSQTSSDWDKNFIQTTNLSFNEDETLVDWDGDGTIGDADDAQGFSSIGNISVYFTGSYNGNGHTISNLYISDLSNYQGMFGVLSTANVEKLGLINVHIDLAQHAEDLQYAGGLVGLLYQSAVIQCYVSGQINAGFYDFVGGIVGKSDYYSIIANSYNLASIYGYASVGGICGGNCSSSTIIKCYNNGYTLGRTSNYVNALAGNLLASGQITDSYWNTDTTGQTTQPVGGQGKTSLEMQLQGNYANWDFMEESSNGTDNTWGISPIENGGFPFLTWQAYEHYAIAPTGSGTEANPYQISTLANLYWLSQNSQEWNKYYVQNNDINVALAASWYDNAGFFPIGNENTCFAGHYEGNNHTISNLTIARNEQNYIGLFGTTDGATIENLSMTHVNIIGNAYIGALAGKITSTLVKGCHSNGILQGASIGGLIGYNASSSEISHCYNEATLDGHGTVGGLVGLNEGLVQFCYNIGNVTGTSQYIGGLIGISNYITKYCYNTGQVNGYENVGGLIGYGFANNCYNIGQVSGHDYVGGLLGYGSASYCYNAGQVNCTTAYAHKGGLTGHSTSSTTACYYDKNTSGQSSDGGSSTGLTTMEMQMEYQYRGDYSYQSDWDFMGESENGTLDIWGISPLVNDGYPFLSWQGFQHYGTQPEGSGTEAIPYIVDELADLYWISQKTERWANHYIQSCDINASATYFWCGGSGFLPFGAGDANDEFSGSYDGQGHEISSLWINREHEYEVGFIGKSDAIGNVVENLGLPDAFIKGKKYVGGFIGYSNDGDISQSYISGTLIGIDDYVGGIVGYNHGSNLNNCYNHSNVSGNNYVGGLSGDLSKYINKCYSQGLVSGNENTGGLVGYCYLSNSVNDSFWDIETSGQFSSEWGIGKTTAEMTSQSTYGDAGWDFTSSIWQIDQSENDGYPYLTWQLNEEPPPLGLEPTGNPRQVSTLDHLLWICNNNSSWGDSFILTADIDASPTSSWNNGAGFSPIGTSSTAFSGTFNGDNFVISNLVINRPNQDYLGLFGYLSNGTLNNISLENIDITGNQQIGGLVGYLAGTSNISSCHVTGSVSAVYRLGGVIGYDYMSGNGIIEESSFNGALVASGGNSGVGGFIGEKSGNSIIQKCSAEGTITAAGRNCGGFVGWLDEGQVNESYSNVNITNNTSSNGRIGGFAGALSYYSGRAGEINNCYSKGSVNVPNSTNTSSYGIGAFVGAYYANGDNKVYNSYASGLVNAPNAASYVGGFSGEDHSGSICGSGNFWDQETTNMDWSGCEGLGEIGKTTPDMKIQNTFLNADWNFTHIWKIDGLNNEGYPYLQWQNYFDFPAGETTDLGGGVSIIATVDLNLADDQTIPESPNGHFTPEREFVLTGNGIGNISFNTSYHYGAYYRNGNWYIEENSGGIIEFVSIDFDAKGDLPFAFGDESSLPVNLSSFTAIYSNSTLTINWVTQSESNNLGWKIYRSQSNDVNEAFLLNYDLIEGAATTTETTEYAFVDPYPVDLASDYWFWLESINFNGESEFHGPAQLTITPDNNQEDTPEIPKIYGLCQNYPNPFNPSTTISLTLRETDNCELSIYNIKGRKVKTLFHGKVQADKIYNFTWDGTDNQGKNVASGIYLYKMQTGKNIQTKKMIIQK